MSVKRRTRAELEQELRNAADREADLGARLERTRMEIKTAQQGAEDLRKMLDEVKERLASSERENARMRGYLDRVMEDDHVHEELIAIGEPGGEQQLVPKRKHREQPREQPYGPATWHNQALGLDLVGDGYRDACSDRERKPRRHWVTY